MLLITSGAFRRCISPRAVAVLLKLLLPPRFSSKSVCLDLPVLLTEKAKEGQKVEMRCAEAVVALSAIVAAGLCTREARIHAMSWAKLVLRVGLSLSCRNSVKLFGGMFKLRVLRVYIHM